MKELHPDGVLAVKSNGKKIFIGKHRWVQYGYSFDKKEGSVDARETGAATQIGCKPATASTIHKAQGLTLESVYLDLEDHWIPESGVYLGLSRCKSLEGIGLSRPISHKDIHILQEPMEFVLGS